jgi:hypothetical protein
MPLEHREKLIDAAKRDRRSLAGFLIDSALTAAKQKNEIARRLETVRLR